VEHGERVTVLGAGQRARHHADPGGAGQASARVPVAATQVGRLAISVDASLPTDQMAVSAERSARSACSDAAGDARPVGMR